MSSQVGSLHPLCAQWLRRGRISPDALVVVVIAIAGAVSLTSAVSVPNDVTWTSGGVVASFYGYSGQIKMASAAVPGRFFRVQIDSLIEQTPAGVATANRVDNLWLYFYTWVGPLSASRADAYGAPLAASVVRFATRDMTVAGKTVAMNITATKYERNMHAPVGNGTFEVDLDSLQFAVDLEGWPFLSPANELVLTMDVTTSSSKGPSQRITAISPNQTRYTIDQTGFVDVSNVVLVDGAFRAIVPVLNRDTYLVSVSLEFPSFSTSLHYDAAIGLTPRNSGAVLGTSLGATIAIALLASIALSA